MQRQRKNRIRSKICVLYRKCMHEVWSSCQSIFTVPRQIVFRSLTATDAALNCIDGMGDKAAEAVVDAAKQGKFLSKDDFRDRTKVSKTVIDLMDDLGIFGDIPQSNQFSLFDGVIA